MPAQRSLLAAGLEAIGSVALGVVAWWAFSAWGRWRDPGGSAFPPGLPLGIVAAVGSIVLYVLAARSRRLPIIIAGAAGPLLVLLLVALVCLPAQR